MENKNKYNQILEEAAKLFAKKGYKATSVKEIAEKLNITKATIYHYFSSKEEILFEIMNSAMDDALNDLQKIANMKISPLEKLEESLRFYSKYYVKKQEDLILLVNELNSLNEKFKEILIEKEQIYVNLFKSILTELKNQGLLKDIPLTIIAFTFFGIVHYTIKWYKAAGEVNPEKLSEYFVEIFTKGIIQFPI
jgi:AcrR family transcriptional regulator